MIVKSFGIYYTEVLSALVLRTSSFPYYKRMTDSNNQVNVLLQRLNEAEQKAKCLKLEIKDIRIQIATLTSTLTRAANARFGTENSSKFELLAANSRKEKSSKRHNDESDSGCEYSKRLRNDDNLSIDDGYVVVFTDGACENNGKANAKAGIGVWFGDGSPLNISKPVNGRATNNTAEIQAPTEALKVLQTLGYKKVKILTDSQFTINCITKWIQKWKKNSWKLASGGPVKNKEDLVKLDSIIQQFDDVKWEYIAGHRGHKGNEEADKLAREGALRYKP